MSQGTVHSEVNKVICEAVGCFAEATTEIVVKVGQLGTIPLRLCKFCVGKSQTDKLTGRKERKNVFFYQSQQRQLSLQVWLSNAKQI
jgi:hypothetical protein